MMRTAPVMIAAATLCLAFVTLAGAAEKARVRTLVPKDVSSEFVVRSLTPVGIDEDTEVSVAAPVTFLFNSADLTDEALDLLNTIAQALLSPELKDYRFLIEGHTDASGSAVYNKSLSERRAASVLRYLTNRGIDDRQLVAVGHGESRLLEGVSPNAERNRRVEVVRVAKK